MIKREVLQESSGLKLPLPICSKLLMQTLWKMQVEWDEPLETELNRELQEILKDLPSVSVVYLHQL